jgi:hypothetical protein
VARLKPLIFALAAHVIVLLVIRPASPWEFDEPLFFQALHEYDPVAHHPPPPGYPVFVFVGKLVRFVVPNDFYALLAISVVASGVGFVMLALALRNLFGQLSIGVIGASLFYFSPGMLVHSTLPISEPGALALLFAGLYFSTKAQAGACALLYGLAVGWRVQFAIFVVPLFLAQVVFMRRRALALSVFTAVCIAWLIPLAVAVGGIDELIAFETGQGKYLVAHDAAESRTGWTLPRLVFRFVAHPFGTKLLSFPVLLAAAIGAVIIVRERMKQFLPLAIAGAVYIAFALAVMDPADGVRYAIPFVFVVAGAAAVALQRVPVAAAAFACASLIYTGSFLWQRSTTDSPPVRAARYALANMPRNAVALYDLPLWPHATYYLAAHRPVRVNDGLARYFDRPDVPLYIYADGRGAGEVFEWMPSDAYSKLTRNHYRVVSIIPVPPEEKMQPLSGVYSIERAHGEPAWRWLAPAAELRLPSGGARTLTLRFRLPPTYPRESNNLKVFVDSEPFHRVVVRRGQHVDVTFPVFRRSPRIRIESQYSYVPAEIPASLNYDRRRLSVMLLHVRTSRAPATELPRTVSQ